MSEEQSVKDLAIIAVVTCQRYKHKLDAQLETWIPVAIQQGFRVEIFDGERLGVPDDYLSLPMKTQAICKWVLDHNYQHVLKIDDDAYVRTSLLHVPRMYYGGTANAPNDYGWNGHPSMPESPKGTHPFPYASGGAYWMSMQAMEIIACEKITDWAEDRWVGNTLGRAGIKLVELPGYRNVMGTIDNYLTKESIVLMQIQDPNDIKKCHKSAFTNIIKPLPTILPTSLRKPIFRRPIAARYPPRKIR